MLKSLPRRLLRTLIRFRDRADLSVSAMVAVAAGLVAAAGTLGVLVAVTEDVTRHNGMATSDAARLRWLMDHRPQALVAVARIVSELANPVALTLLAALVAGALWYCGQRLLLAIAPGLAFGLGGLGAAVGKTVVGRTRPPLRLRLVSESDPSFPSGHATESTALFLTLALVLAVFVMRKPIARILVVFGATLASFAVGAGRLVLGVHWPTDVIAGWALGATIALAVTLIAGLTVRAVPKQPETERPFVARFVRLVTSERRAGRLEAV